MDKEEQWNLLMHSIRKAARILGIDLHEKELPDYMNWRMARDLNTKLWGKVRNRKERPAAGTVVGYGRKARVTKYHGLKENKSAGHNSNEGHNSKLEEESSSKLYTERRDKQLPLALE